MSVGRQSWVAGALIGVAATMVTFAVAVVAVILLPALWPRPLVADVAALCLLGAGCALIAVSFIRLEPWQLGLAAVVEGLLAAALLVFLDQAVLDVWGKPVRAVVRETTQHERNAPTGQVTGTWQECSLRWLDGTERHRSLRESDFVPLGRTCPASTHVGERITVYTVPGEFAAPQTNPPVGGAGLVVALTVAATTTAAALTAVGMTRPGAPKACRAQMHGKTPTLQNARKARMPE
ncbi:hypothetical protein ACWEKM_12160 [Streptomyces sp. NPDC004752]